MDEQTNYLGWNTKWLNGPEYAKLLVQREKYCSKYGFIVMDYKCHPDQIYTQPENGMIYFVKGDSIGSDFGFPRVNLKKHYRWKKMNFKTNLPKGDPIVTYIVSSAMTTNKNDYKQNEQYLYRMHAVILSEKFRRESAMDSEYILCHIRKIDSGSKLSRLNLKDSFAKEQNSQLEVFKIHHHYQYTLYSEDLNKKLNKILEKEEGWKVKQKSLNEVKIEKEYDYHKILCKLNWE